MVTLVFCTALAQLSSGPEGLYGVAIVSKRQGEEQAKVTAAKVTAALEAEGLSGVIDLDETARRLKSQGELDTRNCAGARACIAKLARLLGPNAVVVGVDVGAIRNQLVVRLEAMSASSSEPIETLETSTTIGELTSALDSALPDFARSLKKKRAPTAPETPEVAEKDSKPISPPRDAPVDAHLAPKARVEADWAAPGEKEKSPAQWVLMGGAVATAGATVAFGLLGLSAKRTIDESRYDAGGVTGSRMTGPELDRAVATTNAFFTASIASAIATAALGAGATYLFIRGDEP